MKKYYIKKNSILHYTIKLIQVILLLIATLTACCEYFGTNEIQVNILIKLITIISILLLIIIDKIKIK